MTHRARVECRRCFRPVGFFRRSVTAVSSRVRVSNAARGERLDLHRCPECSAAQTDLTGFPRIFTHVRLPVLMHVHASNETVGHSLV